ncbi:fluoride efflux transporter CrcB [Actinomadura sp. DC4]|uniref:fluoride efflux transporter CrcB n=1 Tax=Actinomadura sp. DC4 TaxID=3055069 RepID=UPI0025AEE49A|nr:fluoride efflux transporter CrcB [Actinomadura sp. DC4]MDN3351542.1 fluoride efflux transporter CrcB [Actinomadura sp. DC4]
MMVLLVFLGGTIGAPARYLLDRAVQRRHESVFPWGTLVVNLTGCLILGLLTGAAQSLPKDLLVFAGTGVCGAFTTFSTFSFETTRLLEEGSLLEAGLNAFVSLLLGFVAAAAGYALTTGL